MFTAEDADAFGKKLANATQRVVDDYASGDVVHEEPFSDQLCGRLKETVHDFETENVVWQTDVAIGGKGPAHLRMRSLTKTKEEPVLGADLVMVLDIQLDDFQVQKGILAQAKRLELGKNMDANNLTRLRNQCGAMLSITPASMVLLYHRGGVTPVSAAAVLAYQGKDLHSINTYGMGIFYTDFAMCWIGDTDIRATDQNSLEALRQMAQARAAIRFSGTGRTYDDIPDGAPPRRGPRRKLDI